MKNKEENKEWMDLLSRLASGTTPLRNEISDNLALLLLKEVEGVDYIGVGDSVLLLEMPNKRIYMNRTMDGFFVKMAEQLTLWK
jgi:hypothetical protein